MGFYKTEAIVLRTQDFREADTLVTVLSSDLGKLRVLARGARKAESRLRGGIQPFTQTTLMLHTSRFIDLITGSDTAKIFNFRESLSQLSYGLYWVNLVEQVVEEREGNSALYSLLLKALYLLEALEDAPKELETLNRLFELKLISQAGYQPELFTCVHCQKDLTPGNTSAWFSYEDGGVICAACGSAVQPGLQPVSWGTVVLLQRWLAGKIEDYRRIRASEYSLQDLARLLPNYIEYQLEREIRSRRITQQLAKE